MKQNTLKKFWERFWFILWKDQSAKGWILSLIIIFVFIKFIFFPGLSLITGTTLPLAIVESCSMYHADNMLSSLDNWWPNQEKKYSDFQIVKEEFNKFRLKRGFTKGDILFIKGIKPEKVKIGDTIIFNAGRQNPIIHRVVNINLDEQTNKRTFSTIGDNNPGQLDVEKQISEDQIIGKAVFRLVPYAGWVKLIFYESQRSEYEKGFCRPKEN